ncbi:MAG: hypothetical protein HKN74_13480 [Acidimicrobiia bacterium]|nr:hypothetical protein [Acidimicrobiia bacterium]
MDNDLIFDLAAGLLPEHEARAAEAALSPEGRAELEAQRAILAAISSEPAPALTDLERARLHRAVAGGIADTTRELSPVASVAPPKRRSVVWMRVASAAAAAALFVGVVAVGSQLGSSDVDATADPIGTAQTEELQASGALASSTTSPGADAADGDGRESFAGAESPPAGDTSLSLLEAPALTETPAESDLADLTSYVSEIMSTQRDAFDEALTDLPCYAVATEDDDLAIAEGFLVDYPDPDGESRRAIGFADEGTESSPPLIRLYDLETCEPVGDNSN